MNPKAQRQILQVLLNGGDLSSVARKIPATLINKFKSTGEAVLCLQSIYGEGSKVFWKDKQAYVIADTFGFWIFYQRDDGYHFFTGIVLNEEEHKQIVKELEAQSDNWIETKNYTGAVLTFRPCPGCDPIEDTPENISMPEQTTAPVTVELKKIEEPIDVEIIDVEPEVKPAPTNERHFRTSDNWAREEQFVQNSINRLL